MSCADNNKVSQYNRKQIAACLEHQRFTMAPTLEERIESLQEFEAENGHMVVPYAYSGKGKLGYWVGNMRAKRKKGALKPDVVAKLDEVGFASVALKGPELTQLVEGGKQFHR